MKVLKRIKHEYKKQNNIYMKTKEARTSRERRKKRDMKYKNEEIKQTKTLQEKKICV